MADLSAWMRRVDEQLRKLATATRANYTTVRGGGGFTIMNLEGSAPAFRMGTDGATFPLTASAWQPDYEFSGMDAQGRRTNTTSTFQFQWHVVLSLVTPYVAYSFSPFPDLAATANELRFEVRALDDRSDGGVHQIGSDIEFDNSYPNVQSGVLTIPSDILENDSDVVGSVILLTASTRIATGSGTLAIAPDKPAYCVDSPT